MLFKQKVRAQYAIDKLIHEARKHAINGDFLDIGAGDRSHTKYIERANVFANCFSIDSYPHTNADNHIIGDFQSHEFNRKFDAILASHVLEHSLNVGIFLAKINMLLNEGGVFCIIVPPLKHDITCGHTTLWNGGLLLLNCVKAGFDCRDISLRKKGYNIALVGRKSSCQASFGFDQNVKGNERYYLPSDLAWHKKRSNEVWYFKGDIRSINW